MSNSPPIGLHGSDEFACSVTDTEDASASARVGVTEAPVSDAPRPHARTQARRAGTGKSPRPGVHKAREKR